MKVTGKNLWFTSDTHYMHKNMCKGVTRWDISTPEKLDSVRDFETLEEMNDALVNNINNVVDENDYLFHNGDWAFGGFEMIEEFRSKINCKNIFLTIGNHDHHIRRNKNNVRKLFSDVYRMEDLYITSSVKKHSEHIILCHFPILSWENMRSGSIMLHGHQHLKRDQRFGNGKRMDVGVCGSPEFRPYHLDEILDIMKDRVSYEIS